MRDRLARLMPYFDDDDGGAGGSGSGEQQPDKKEKSKGKEDIPQWAREMQKQIESLSKLIGSGKTEDVQQIPKTDPPPNPANKAESPKSLSSEPKAEKKDRTFLDWLIG